MRNPEHLGDGVYAFFDGYGITLRANNHREEYCTDRIYIEPSVLDELNKFSEYHNKDKINN